MSEREAYLDHIHAVPSRGDEQRCVLVAVRRLQLRPATEHRTGQSNVTLPRSMAQPPVRVLVGAVLCRHLADKETRTSPTLRNPAAAPDTRASRVPRSHLLVVSPRPDGAARNRPKPKSAHTPLLTNPALSTSYWRRHGAPTALTERRHPQMWSRLVPRKSRAAGRNSPVLTNARASRFQQSVPLHHPLAARPIDFLASRRPTVGRLRL